MAPILTISEISVSVMACKLDDEKKWTAIVLTCQSENGSYVIQVRSMSPSFVYSHCALDEIVTHCSSQEPHTIHMTLTFQYLYLQQELEDRQRKGLIDKDVLLLSVEDPKARVGSGGATLNALHVVAEHIGSKLGHTIVTADILQNSHILLMHMGRNFPFDSCGRTFTSLPIVHKNSNDTDFVFTNFDMLLSTMSTYVAAEAPPGVWVCSTDMLLNTSVPLSGNIFGDREFCIIATPVSQKYARHHGALKLGDGGAVLDIIYKGKPDVLTESFGNDDIPIISGVVFIGTKMTEKLLSLTITPPLDACTYIGLDNGAQPIELSVFFDIALSMALDIDYDAFVTGKRSGVYGTSEKLTGPKGCTMKQARNLLWRELHGNYKVTAVVAEDSHHSYMDHLASTHHSNLFVATVLKTDNKIWSWQPITHSITPSGMELSEHVTLLNSVIEEGVQLSPKSIVSNCYIPKGIKTGQDSFMSGLGAEDFIDLSGVAFPEKTFLQAFRIRLPILGKLTKMKVLTVIGKFDDVTAPMWKGASTYCNSPWILFLNATGKNITLSI